MKTLSFTRLATALALGATALVAAAATKTEINPSAGDAPYTFAATTRPNAKWRGA